MKTEIEAKFLDVDFVFMREKLKRLGVKCGQPMRLMRRAIIETPEPGVKDAVFGSATSAYQVQYPEGDVTRLVNTPIVAFDQPVPAIISGLKDTAK